MRSQRGAGLKCTSGVSPLSHTLQAKLSVIATERDFAVSEMRQMAEQCQSVAAEFESMANHCEHLMRELEQVLKHLVMLSDVL